MRISDWSSDVCSSDLCDDAHEQMSLAGLSLGDVHETAVHARRHCDRIQRAKLDRFDLPVDLPFEPPLAGDRDERLVGVVIVHQRALADRAFGVANIESFLDADACERGGLSAERKSVV